MTYYAVQTCHHLTCGICWQCSRPEPALWPWQPPGQAMTPAERESFMRVMGPYLREPEPCHTKPEPVEFVPPHPDCAECRKP